MPTTLHFLALPYPGRGHINPMMYLCTRLSSLQPDLLITVVVTEEWLGFIADDQPCGARPLPPSVRLVSIPNVIPSELDRAADFPGFIEAVNTKMEAPLEDLLDRRLEPKEVSCIVADTYLSWAVGLGRRRKIPVASLWPMSPSMLCLLRHVDLLRSDPYNHFPLHHLSGREDEMVEYIPGTPSIRLGDIYPILQTANAYPDSLKSKPSVLTRAVEAATTAKQAQFLLFTCSYELDAPAIDALGLVFPFPVFPLGPCIPHKQLQEPLPIGNINNGGSASYFAWLDRQSQSSVLYVSLGSFLSASSAQMEELAKGLNQSGVPFLWVARNDRQWLQGVAGHKGLVVPWCDQLRVLCHSSVGGFLTHCGWNSTMEAAFAGKPMLTFPILWDQFLDSKLIVDDWRIGLRLKPTAGDDSVLVTGNEIANGVRRLMDLDSEERKDVMNQSWEVKQACGDALRDGGSTHKSLHDFFRHVEQY